MKRSIMLRVVLALFPAIALAKTPQAGHLQKATVYLQGAHLYYTEQVNLQVGTNEFIFENISAGIYANTLQAFCKGGTVMDVSHQVTYQEKARPQRNYEKEIERVTDSIEWVGYRIKDFDNRLSVLETEKKMILSNRIIRGDSPKDSLPLLKEGIDFVHDKLNVIFEESLKLEISKNKFNKLEEKLQLRLQQLQLLQSGESPEDEFQSIAVNQVFISVFADQSGPATLSFNYFIPNASWFPTYDLTANSANNQMQIKYFANVSQNSGLNWKQVALTLSTSNPTENNHKPVLTPWMISMVQTIRKYKALSNSAIPLQAESLSKNEKDNAARNYNANSEINMDDYVQTSQNLLRTEYEIKIKYDITSEAKTHKVLIKQQEIPVLLQFAAVPKLCQDAFLLGRITGWEDLSLIPGNARIYFDGAYVGESFLNSESESDTLNFELGRDKSIVLNRKKIKEKTKTKIIENEKTEIRTIELFVRNTKNVGINLTLEDQIPVSANPETIKVSLIDGNGAILDETTGLLTWNIKLGAKDSRKITFTYEIKSPKNTPIYGL